MELDTYLVPIGSSGSRRTSRPVARTGGSGTRVRSRSRVSSNTGQSRPTRSSPMQNRPTRSNPMQNRPTRISSRTIRSHTKKTIRGGRANVITVSAQTAVVTAEDVRDVIAASNVTLKRPLTRADLATVARTIRATPIPVHSSTTAPKPVTASVTTSVPKPVSKSAPKSITTPSVTFKVRIAPTVTVPILTPTKVILTTPKHTPVTATPIKRTPTLVLKQTLVPNSTSATVATNIHRSALSARRIVSVRRSSTGAIQIRIEELPPLSQKTDNETDLNETNTNVQSTVATQKRSGSVTGAVAAFSKGLRDNAQDAKEQQALVTQADLHDRTNEEEEARKLLERRVSTRVNVLQSVASDVNNTISSFDEALDGAFIEASLHDIWGMDGADVGGIDLTDEQTNLLIHTIGVCLYERGLLDVNCDIDTFITHIEGKMRSNSTARRRRFSRTNAKKAAKAAIARAKARRLIKSSKNPFDNLPEDDLSKLQDNLTKNPNKTIVKRKGKRIPLRITPRIRKLIKQAAIDKGIILPESVNDSIDKLSEDDARDLFEKTRPTGVRFTVKIRGVTVPASKLLQERLGEQITKKSREALLSSTRRASVPVPLRQSTIKLRSRATTNAEFIGSDMDMFNQFEMMDDVSQTTLLFIINQCLINSTVGMCFLDDVVTGYRTSMDDY